MFIWCLFFWIDIWIDEGLQFWLNCEHYYNRKGVDDIMHEPFYKMRCGHIDEMNVFNLVEKLFFILVCYFFLFLLNCIKDNLWLFVKKLISAESILGVNHTIASFIFKIVHCWVSLWYMDNWFSFTCVDFNFLLDKGYFQSKIPRVCTLNMLFILQKYWQIS